MVKLYDKVMLFLIYLIKGSIICIMYLTVHVWLPDLYVWIVHVWKILNLLFIWILKLKYTKSNICVIIFCFICGASYSSIKRLLVCWLSAWLRFFTHLFAPTMLCPTCVFLPPNCCEVVSPLFFLSLTTRSSIVATFVLGWSWRISTPWNRRHRKWNSG